MLSVLGQMGGDIVEVPPRGRPLKDRRVNPRIPVGLRDSFPAVVYVSVPSLMCGTGRPSSSMIRRALVVGQGPGRSV